MKPLARVAGALSLALLTGACGHGRHVPQSEWGPAAGLAAFDINPVPREQLRTGGILRWPLPEFPRRWNLAHAGGADGVATDVLAGLLPYLMRCDEKAVPHPDPDYVLDVRVSTKAGRQVVTYGLNPRAVWSDGSPITYRDFAAQARTMAGRDGRSRTRPVTGYDHIGTVERGADDHQVVVTFETPLADWQRLFSPLYPAVTHTSPPAFGRGRSGGMGPTAGPFALRGMDPVAKTITLTRNPLWWGRPAKLDGIVFRAMDAAAVPAAFEAGRVDVMEVASDAGAYRRAARVKGAVVRTAGGPGWRNLVFNPGSASLSDLRVRRAVALGIDRTAVTASAFGDQSWPRATLGNHFFMNTQAGYQDNSDGLGLYDPGRAMRLLEEAGWTWRGGQWVKNGKALELRLAVSEGVPYGRAEAELIQAMLHGIGVKSVLRTPPGGDGQGHPRGSPALEDFDLAVSSWPGGPFPLSSLQALLTRPYGRGPAGAPAPIRQAMDQALRELDPERARGLTNDADRLMWRDLDVLPLYQRPELVAAPERLANFGARGFYDLVYEDIGFTA